MTDNGPKGLWNAKQRAAIAMLVLFGIVVWGIRLYNNPQFTPNPHPDDGPRAKELSGRIDPNTATWPALTLLPGLGEARAKAIVAYREEFLKAHPGEIAFRNMDDLMHFKNHDDESGVPGIGPARAETLRPYLIFPGEDPAKLRD